MLKKKSYMNRNSLLSEGFFDKLKNFLRLRPKIDKKEFFAKGMGREMNNLNNPFLNLSKNPSEIIFSLFIYDFFFNIIFSSN